MPSSDSARPTPGGKVLVVLSSGLGFVPRRGEHDVNVWSGELG